MRQEELTPAQYKSKDWAKRRDAWRRRLLRKADGGAGGGTDGLTQLTDALIDLEVALLFSAVLASWRGEREDWQERVLRCETVAGIWVMLQELRASMKTPEQTSKPKAKPKAAQPGSKPKPKPRPKNPSAGSASAGGRGGTKGPKRERASMGEASPSAAKRKKPVGAKTAVAWTAAEDALLLRLCRESGVGDWPSKAKEISSLGNPRSPSSVSGRWHGYLSKGASLEGASGRAGGAV